MKIDTSTTSSLPIRSSTKSSTTTEEVKTTTSVGLISSEIITQPSPKQWSCCPKIEISSKGETPHLQPNVIGQYILQQSNGELIYKKPNKKIFLSKPVKQIRHVYTWGVNSNPGRVFGSDSSVKLLFPWFFHPPKD